METRGSDIWKILGTEQKFAVNQYLGTEIGKVLLVNVNNSPFLGALNTFAIQEILSKKTEGNGRGYDTKVLLFKYDKLYIRTNIGKLEPQEEDSLLATFVKDNFLETGNKRGDWAILTRK